MSFVSWRGFLIFWFSVTSFLPRILCFSEVRNEFWGESLIQNISGQQTKKWSGSRRCKHASRFAILISGQMKRFIWRDQAGPLLGSYHDCNPFVDVYVALHHGALGRLFSSPSLFEPPPYVSNTTSLALKKWYEGRGARLVHVKFYSDGDMDALVKEVNKSMVPLQILQGRKKHYFERWKTNVKMLYLRHQAFVMASQAETYNWFIYLREDNFFFVPLQVDFMPFVTTNDTRKTGVVFVDKYCGFGSYPDKIYIADLIGASVLFNKESKAFMARTKSWAVFASEYSIRREAAQNANHRLKGDPFPFQTERFLQHILMSHNVTIIQKEMNRTDMRYYNGELCVPKGYRKCLNTMRSRYAMKFC